MTDSIHTRVTDELDRLDVTYDVIAIDPELADTASFCAAYGYGLEVSANAILIASKRPLGQHAMCVALGTTRLDVNHRVRELMKVKKLSFASSEVTADITGMLIGGVTPFALPYDLPLLVDSRVLDLGQVIVGGGNRETKIALDPEVFNRIPASVVQDLANPAPPPPPPVDA